MTFDRDLKEARKQMKKDEEMDKRYREAFDADLEFMMTPQVDLAAERARDRITPSQPSREVQRQADERPGTLAFVWIALFAALTLGGLLIALARMAT